MAKLTYQGNRVTCATPYNKPFVDAIKHIPFGYRNYNEHDKTWTVYQPYVGEAARLVKTYFSPVEEIGVDEFNRAEQEQKARQAQYERERAERQQNYSRQGFNYGNSYRDPFGNARENAQDGSGREQSQNTAPNHNGPFASLYVLDNAPRQVIEGAYKALARLYHPDTSQEPDATETMKNINRAYAEIKRLRRW